jgi:hypothetical protein
VNAAIILISRMILPHVITVKNNSSGMKGALSVLNVNVVIALTFKTILMPAMMMENNLVIAKRTINTMKRSGNFRRQQILFNI